MEADERTTMSERIPTVDTFEPLHPKKVKAKSSDNLIHTRSFTGLFRTLRVGGAGFLFLAVFRHRVAELGRSPGGAVGLGESKFHIFGATFWPQDFILLSALLIICAFGLFAITVFAGRVWCGYTCPQSSWTWLFMWCEKVTEGDATSASSCKPRRGA
jgi:polyferredoxin